MEIRNIKTFIKVAEIGNFSKAAMDLGYAQSTVTTQIQMLERELKAALFERNGKRVALSAAGEEFLHYAYQILKCEEMALEHFTNEKEPQGQLKIGVMETMCASKYAALFREYLKRYPKVKLNTVVAKTLDCMDLLEKGKLDVILTVDQPIKRPHWETAHMIDTEICFFCAANHPFAKRSSVSMKELIQEKFIQIEAGCNYRQAFEQYLEEQGTYIENVQEVGYTSMIIDCVAENIGISLLPRFTLEEALRQGKIAVVHVKGYGISMYMQVIYSKNKWVTPALRAFLQMSKEYLV